ncbi:hypothetical protein KCP73_01655 [Salmonella enterica subsp. enterica]|nr:hypothetical protein KCP73_01655 [Salmonella enterica subsp. enterica]
MTSRRSIAGHFAGAGAASGWPQSTPLAPVSWPRCPPWYPRSRLCGGDAPAVDIDSHDDKARRDTLLLKVAALPS